VKYPYTLHGHFLKYVDVVKYLGVKISHDLRWNDHIDYVAAKANSTLRFVRRNININNPEVKERAYKTLVRPILEYSSTVWDRSPGHHNCLKKDRVSATKSCSHNLNCYRRTSSVGVVITELNWQPLDERRRIARLVMFYKIHYQLVVITMPLEFNWQKARCDRLMWEAFSSINYTSVHLVPQSRGVLLQRAASNYSQPTMTTLS